MARGATWLNAVIGAVITIGLAFTGFSPLLGGGIAGYLQHESAKRGAMVGALAGAIAAVPIVLIMTLGVWLFAGVPAEMAPVPGGFEVLVMVTVMLPMLLVWFVGLAAAGGYVGAVIRGDVAGENRPE